MTLDEFIALHCMLIYILTEIPYKLVKMNHYINFIESFFYDGNSNVIRLMVQM